MAINIQSCWNKIYSDYKKKLRRKYKDEKIEKIPLSKIKLY